MEVAFSPHFNRSFQKIPKIVQNKFGKQVTYLLDDLAHPSLRAKKYDETSGVWQARVDRSYRFYFIIRGNRYILLDIRKHRK